MYARLCYAQSAIEQRYDSDGWNGDFVSLIKPLTIHSLLTSCRDITNIYVREGRA